MTNEQKREFLLGGNLYRILLQGKGRTEQVYLSESSAGQPLMTFAPQPNAHRMIVDGADIPTLAIDKGALTEEKREEVVAFLQESFGLSKAEAEHVYINARPPSP